MEIDPNDHDTFREEVIALQRRIMLMLVALIAVAVAIALLLGDSEAATLWNGNGVSPTLVQKLDCRAVGIGATVQANPFTGAPTTTAERLFMTQKRALECLPQALIEVDRLLSDSTNPRWVEAHELARTGLSLNWTALKKHIPGMSRVIASDRESPDAGYDIANGEYPWIWAGGRIPRDRAINPLAVAFDRPRSAILQDPRVIGRLSNSTLGYLQGPTRRANADFRARQAKLPPQAIFFVGPEAPTATQKHVVDEMVALGTDRIATILAGRGVATDHPPSGRTLDAIQAEDVACRVEMAEQGVVQLPPHLTPLFASDQPPDKLCATAQRIAFALKMWGECTKRATTPRATINTIASGYAHAVLHVDLASAYRFDLEAAPASVLARKILALRFLAVPGLQPDGRCPLDYFDPTILDDPEVLKAAILHARELRRADRMG